VRLPFKVRPARWLRLFPLLAIAACDSNDSGTLQIVTGEETASYVFTEAPAPTTLTVYAIDSSDTYTQIGQGDAGTTDIDLGDQDESNAATIMVLGTTANGTDVVAGVSLALQYGALVGGTLPVFTQRTNEWARLPNPPTDARQNPTLAILSGEFLFIGGGSWSMANTSAAETIQLYDFAPLAPVSSPPTLPLVPLSMPVIGTVALILGPDGSAGYYDFSQDIQGNVSPPTSEYTFADVAGGQVIYDYDGNSGTLDAVFVVGATRTLGTPTQAVLEIDATNTSVTAYPSGNLIWLSLSAPRLGAAAAWTGSELVITGGSATAAGVETILPTGSPVSGTPNTQFPPDPSMGAGAAQYGGGPYQVLLAGGVTPTGEDPGVRLLNLNCTQPCTTGLTTVWGSLSTPVTSASTFLITGNGATSTMSPYAALVVGNELVSGLTHTYLLNSAGATELQPKVPHYNASAIQSPLGFGSILLFGGADEIEQLMPPQSG
jgi:hypothetical protein